MNAKLSPELKIFSVLLGKPVILVRNRFLNNCAGDCIFCLIFVIENFLGEFFLLTEFFFSKNFCILINFVIFSGRKILIAYLEY